MRILPNLLCAQAFPNLTICVPKYPFAIILTQVSHGSGTRVRLAERQRPNQCGFTKFLRKIRYPGVCSISFPGEGGCGRRGSWIRMPGFWSFLKAFGLFLLSDCAVRRALVFAPCFSRIGREETGKRVGTQEGKVSNCAFSIHISEGRLLPQSPDQQLFTRCLSAGIH